MPTSSILSDCAELTALIHPEPLLAWIVSDSLCPKLVNWSSSARIAFLRHTQLRTETGCFTWWLLRKLGSHSPGQLFSLSLALVWERALAPRGSTFTNAKLQRHRATPNYPTKNKAKILECLLCTSEQVPDHHCLLPTYPCLEMQLCLLFLEQSTCT